MNDEKLSGTDMVHRSMWLPVGRANFYSYTANNWLKPDPVPGQREALEHSDQLVGDYSPYLQVSVLRRLLEVLPMSFGYEEQGVCSFSEDVEEGLSRPVAVTMTLYPKVAMAQEIGHRRRANASLVEASVDEVQLHVTEEGFYTFSVVKGGGDVAAMERALAAHASEVFGGRFSLQWQRDHLPPEDPARNAILSAGGAPARVYNGRPPSADSEPAGPFYPEGILTFFQLNTLFEGLYNDALAPAVFFEDDFMDRFQPLGATPMSGAKAATSKVNTVADAIAHLSTALDARATAGQALTLRHFLAVTARESLHRLKWSVESVRRSLLDEMMGILHRQSQLVQLRLDKLGEHERTPELAVGANESQLRGYVMLAGAKAPLIANAHRFAENAARSLGWPGSVPPGTTPGTDVSDLDYRLKEWSALLDAIADNIRGLEKAVEHAWMERLLYEQQQARAEQEAMAEIERTRSSRPGPAGAGSGGTYNGLMLLFTVAAGVASFMALRDIGEDAPIEDWILSFLPLGVTAVVLVGIAAITRAVRYLRDRSGESDRYGYEFSYSLDRVVSAKVFEEVTRGTRASVAAADDAAARALRHRLRGLRLDRRGGIRIEYMSTESTVVKIHAAARFLTRKQGTWLNPTTWLNRTVRFEVINEILARTVSGNAQYVLRESRIFGDTPRVLKPEQIEALVTFILNRTALALQERTGKHTPLTAQDVMKYSGPILTQGDLAKRPSRRRMLWMRVRGQLTPQPPSD